MSQHVAHRASDEIARLNAELDRLRAENERVRLENSTLRSPEWLKDWHKTNQELRAENERLQAMWERLDGPFKLEDLEEILTLRAENERLRAFIRASGLDAVWLAYNNRALLDTEAASAPRTQAKIHDMELEIIRLEAFSPKTEDRW